jgi:hypothetical protein
MNNENEIENEISRRLMTGNRTYFSHIQLFKSNILSKTTKVKLYKTLVWPVVTYGSETWTLRVADENSLHVFERKIIRRIYGPICSQRNWRIRTNRKIGLIIGHEDIVNFNK